MTADNKLPDVRHYLQIWQGAERTGFSEVLTIAVAMMTREQVASLAGLLEAGIGNDNQAPARGAEKT